MNRATIYWSVSVLSFLAVSIFAGYVRLEANTSTGKNQPFSAQCREFRVAALVAAERYGKNSESPSDIEPIDRYVRCIQSFYDKNGTDRVVSFNKFQKEIESSFRGNTVAYGRMINDLRRMRDKFEVGRREGVGFDKAEAKGKAE